MGRSEGDLSCRGTMFYHYVPIRRDWLRSIEFIGGYSSILAIETGQTTPKSKSNTKTNTNTSQIPASALQTNSFPRLTRLIVLFSIIVTVSSSLHAPSFLPWLSEMTVVIPSSPIHLMDPPVRGLWWIEYLNAFLCVFLPTPDDSPGKAGWLTSKQMVTWISNALLCGLLESSFLDSPLPVPLPIHLLLPTIWALVISMRVLLAFAFTFATGWAVPQLFWSNAGTECGSGLGPLLLALTVLSAIRRNEASAEEERCVFCFTTISAKRSPGRSGAVPAISITDRPGSEPGPTNLSDGYSAPLWRSSCQVLELHLGPGDDTPSHPIHLHLRLPEPIVHLSLASIDILLAKGQTAWWNLSGILSGGLVGLLVPLFVGGGGMGARLKGLLGNFKRMLGVVIMALVLVGLSVEMGSSSQPSPSVIVRPNRTLPSWNSSHLSNHESLVPLSEQNFTPSGPSRDQKFMTILLMTAPRPGNPDFLIKTLESYLDNFPDPSSPSFSNFPIEIVVYTHFSNHPIFNLARDFVFHPDRNPKSAKFVRWIQQGSGSPDRLDLRLHLARALDLVSRNDGDRQRSRYIILAEDDFPLCPDSEGLAEVDRADWGLLSDWSSRGIGGVLKGVAASVVQGRAVRMEDGVRLGKSHRKCWGEIMRLIKETNVIMPDRNLSIPPPTTDLVQRPVTSEVEASNAGHCGVFVGTGGSGLIVRGWLAERMPDLLLGQDDRLGYRREARLSSSRDGNDTTSPDDDGPPDLVLQDCLLGKVPGCEECSPRSFRHSFGRSHPPRSARDPFFLQGDRYGKSGLVTSERLLMRHLGYNASTIPDRKYKREEWNCGWRHPFNGNPNVVSLPRPQPP